MYHIQNDKRAQNSASLIWNALKQCAKEKGYEAITISDICRVSTVSRATFYRLFDRKADVLSWGLNLLAEDFWNTIQGRTMREKLESYFTVWMDNPEALDLVVLLPRESILYESYHLKLDLVEEHFMKINSSPYHAPILFFLFYTLLISWAQNGKKESPAEMTEILFQVISDLGACFTAK